MTMPVTSDPRASLVIDYAVMKSLSSDLLKAWANQLLNLGIASDRVVDVAVGSDIPPEKLDDVFRELCGEVGIDLSNGLIAAKEAAVIDEYRSGFYKAPHVLHVCNHLRETSGFPEMITARLVWDGTKESATYTGMESGMTSSDLETLCEQHLASHGIERTPKDSG